MANVIALQLSIMYCQRLQDPKEDVLHIVELLHSTVLSFPSAISFRFAPSSNLIPKQTQENQPEYETVFVFRIFLPVPS